VRSHARRRRILAGPRAQPVQAAAGSARGEFYADGFELTDYADTSGLAAGWSTDPEFLAGLRTFAQANASRSIYALWRVDDRAELASLPVVVFGDDGGQHIVARNLLELLQLVGYDSEISVDWECASFHRARDYEPSAGHDEYVAWLDRHFGLSPAKDPDAVVAAAQAELGERFARWLARYLPD
jgi:hypothetical protein